MTVLTLARTGQKSSYEIAGTRGLRVQRDSNGLWAVLATEPRGADWTSRTGLRNVSFPSRADALQAVAAHAAAVPLPPAEAPSDRSTLLRRRRAGDYRTPDSRILVRRDDPADAWKMELSDGRVFEHVPSLRLAQRTVDGLYVRGDWPRRPWPHTPD